MSSGQKINIQCNKELSHKVFMDKLSANLDCFEWPTLPCTETLTQHTSRLSSYIKTRTFLLCFVLLLLLFCSFSMTKTKRFLNWILEYLKDTKDSIFAANFIFGTNYWQQSLYLISLDSFQTDSIRPEHFELIKFGTRALKGSVIDNPHFWHFPGPKANRSIFLWSG